MKKIFLSVPICISCFSLFAQDNTTTRFIDNLEKARKATADKRWAESVTLWEAVINKNSVNGE